MSRCPGLFKSNSDHFALPTLLCDHNVQELVFLFFVGIGQIPVKIQKVCRLASSASRRSFVVSLNLLLWDFIGLCQVPMTMLVKSQRPWYLVSNQNLVFESFKHILKKFSKVCLRFLLRQKKLRKNSSNDEILKNGRHFLPKFSLFLPINRLGTDWNN